MKAATKSAHKPISNRSQISVSPRFLSEGPNLGLGEPHPSHPNGFEAIPGYRLKPPRETKSNLRNISELTYGPRPFKLQDGEGVPTQTQVSDTTLYPWRANAVLKVIIPGKVGIFLASGWFIGPCAVVTAAHAVYPREPGIYAGWASQIEVIPGLNGDANPPPFGSFTSNLFYCPDGWQSEGDLRLDYGVVLLNQAVGAQLGTYGYVTYSDDDLRASVANLAGYPEYTPDGSPGHGTQWYDAGNVADVDESFVYYDLETQPGESGSCVYKNVGDQRYAIAIHTAGQGAVGTVDRGVRITEPVFENLKQWAPMRG
jgi:glutamyl endopeptidase